MQGALKWTNMKLELSKMKVLLLSFVTWKTVLACFPHLFEKSIFLRGYLALFLWWAHLWHPEKKNMRVFSEGPRQEVDSWAELWESQKPCDSLHVRVWIKKTSIFFSPHSRLREVRAHKSESGSLGVVSTVNFIRLSSYSSLFSYVPEIVVLTTWLTCLWLIVWLSMFSVSFSAESHAVESLTKQTIPISYSSIVA